MEQNSQRSLIVQLPPVSHDSLHMRSRFGQIQRLSITGTKGVSTAEGGRGHVTAYTMCTPSKIQMNGPDILNIDRSATE